MLCEGAQEKAGERGPGLQRQADYLRGQLARGGVWVCSCGDNVVVVRSIPSVPRVAAAAAAAAVAVLLSVLGDRDRDRRQKCRPSSQLAGSKIEKFRCRDLDLQSSWIDRDRGLDLFDLFVITHSLALHVEDVVSLTPLTAE